MKITTLLAGIVLCALCPLRAAPPGDNPAVRTQHWQEDLDLFAREFLDGQKGFALLVRPSDFAAAVARWNRPAGNTNADSNAPVSFGVASEMKA